jgi:acylphosphatase
LVSHWFVERAGVIGVTGWVRNRADSSVEAMVVGSSEMIEAIYRYPSESWHLVQQAAHSTD